MVWGFSEVQHKKKQEQKTAIVHSKRGGRIIKRSMQTYKNKTRNVTTQYNRTMRVSLKSKAHWNKQDEIYQKKHPREFFCDKYTTLESFIKNYNIKTPK